MVSEVTNQSSASVAVWHALALPETMAVAVVCPSSKAPQATNDETSSADLIIVPRCPTSEPPSLRSSQPSHVTRQKSFRTCVRLPGERVSDVPERFEVAHVDSAAKHLDGRPLRPNHVTADDALDQLE